MPRFSVVLFLCLACALASAASAQTRRAFSAGDHEAPRQASHESATKPDDGNAPSPSMRTPPESASVPLGKRNQSPPVPLARPASEREVGSDSSGASAIVTALGSLAIVLGLFFGVTWMLRRAMPARSQLLPRDVLEVLGRSPLPGRQHVHLIRLGNKLLLVSSAASGVETLTEITDPLEVDRLTGLCHQTQPTSATNSFRQVFQQLAGERTKDVGRPDQRLTGPKRPVGGRQASVMTDAEDDDV